MHCSVTTRWTLAGSVNWFGGGCPLMSKDWPIKKCTNCDRLIRLVRTKFGWKPYELDDYKPLVCGSDVYDLPPKRVRNIFNPRDTK